jgi:hypothetical protein
MIDFYFDDYSISSKAGAGGTPSGDNIIQKIYSSYSQGNLSFNDSQETDFLNNVILPWVSAPKLSKSSIYNNVMNLCSINIRDKSNSGYWYLVSKTNLQPNQLTENDVVKYFDSLHSNLDEFKDVLSTLWDKSGFSWNKKMLDEYSNKYMSMQKKIGPIFYPLTVEIVKELNSNWKGGIAKPLLYPKGIWTLQLKERIRVRDNHTCRFCGVPELECNRRLSIHHIDYNEQNCQENNLISLCTSCHGKTNKKREEWKAKLSQLMLV